MMLRGASGRQSFTGCAEALYWRRVLIAIDAAEHSYKYAIAIAQCQHARSLELRATTSLSRLLQSQSRNEEARSLLASIYRWFTEGFDTLDLKEAKALLDDLAS